MPDRLEPSPSDCPTCGAKPYDQFREIPAEPVRATDPVRAAAEALIAQADHPAYVSSGNSPVLDLGPLRAALAADREPEPVQGPTQYVTHGRHCLCSACKREDWTNPVQGPCGMHGPGCPARYQPLGLAGEGLPSLWRLRPPRLDREPEPAQVTDEMVEREDVQEALDAVDKHAERDLDHELHAIVQHYRGALLAAALSDPPPEGEKP